MIEAICAKPMKWLAALHSSLTHVSESPSAYGLQFIVLLLTFPVFHAHNLLFKIVYAGGQRRLRLLCRSQSRLGLKNLILESDLDIIDARLRIGSIQALKEVSSRLKAAKGSSNFS